MKTKTITYQKVFNLGDYSNEKIGVDLELESGDDVQSAVDRARDFVENQHQLNKKKGQYLQACSVIENPADYTGRQIEMAKQVKADYESMLTGTPLLLQS